MQLSEQQLAVVQAIAHNDKDVRVDARAGTGKTTTIIAATKTAQEHGAVTFFAFNKSIANELKRRAPPGVNVQTLHSFGFRAVRSFYEDVFVDEDKSVTLIEKAPWLPEGSPHRQTWLATNRRGYYHPVKKLTGLVKNLLCESDPETLSELCDIYDVNTDGLKTDVLFDLVQKVLHYGTPDSSETSITIDYDDMIYLPAVLPWIEIPTYDWTFCDEAQDINPAQRHLVLGSAKGGRICFVGDPFQAIYGFRGADTNSMNNIQAALESEERTVVTLPLTKTRRCPKTVVKVAQQWVPDIEALDEAPDGLVRYVAREGFQADHGDMVLCRTNAPVVRAAYALLREKKRVRIQGRDLGMTIVSLVRGFKATTIEELEDRLGAYHERQLASIQRRYATKPSKLKNNTDALNDKVEVVRILIEQYDSPEELMHACMNIFSDEGAMLGQILCSTVHRAKGLESSRVWILQTGFQGSDGQAGNVAYVACTRAMRELVYVRWDE